MLELFIIVPIDDIACHQPVAFHNMPWDLVNDTHESVLNGGVTVVDERRLSIRINKGR